jgi:hypothetical protein
VSIAGTVPKKMRAFRFVFNVFGNKIGGTVPQKMASIPFCFYTCLETTSEAKYPKNGGHSVLFFNVFLMRKSEAQYLKKAWRNMAQARLCATLEKKSFVVLSFVKSTLAIPDLQLFLVKLTFGHKRCCYETICFKSPWTALLVSNICVPNAFIVLGI